MARVKFYFDPVANTLNIWWGKKDDAYESIPVKSSKRDDVIIVDKEGHPVSLEIINFLPEELEPIGYLTKKQITQYLNTGSVNLEKPKLLLQK